MASDLKQPGFQFTTKGRSLRTVRPLLEPRGLSFCEQILFTIAEWRTGAEDIVSEIVSTFAALPLAIRSSSIDEDGREASNAGRFTSLIDVEATADSVRDAICEVIASYDSDADENEVLVQPMVRGVTVSGVILTRDLATGGPYFVIDYDDESGATNTVTSGLAGRSIAVHRDTPEAQVPANIRDVVTAAREIERATQHEALDIEFCITGDGAFYVLQVRPLASRQNWTWIPDDEIDGTIDDITATVDALMAPVEGLGGNRTVLGDMPDWNPAEMIGSAPRMLALSLYQRQITDRTWAQARREMGYRFVDRPLMQVLHGRPYIDVRLSFNSFLPADLPAPVADRLIDHQVRQLELNPELHDKIEFEIALTCFSFDFDQRLAQLTGDNISPADCAALRDAQLDLTRRNVNRGRMGIEALLATSDPVIYASMPASTSPLDHATRILDLAILHGTLPFSKLARHAFISMSFLKSLVVRGILSSQDFNSYLTTISTVANDLVDALNRVSHGMMSLDIFLTRFGHLRPGTYDISSLRYDERPDVYFHNVGTPSFAVAERKRHSFAFTARQLKETDRLLQEYGFKIDARGLFDYISSSIAAREEAKFNFTRGISDALRLIAQWGAAQGIDRDVLADIRFEDIYNCRNDAAALGEAADKGRRQHMISRTLRMPHLITADTDFRVIAPGKEKPNFITDQTVAAQIVCLDQSGTTESLDGKVLIIESADPGYDWIFSHSIAGLITLYGGANSHMAIRCAEFGLPAAIGCGQKLYDAALNANWLEMNCGAQTISFH